MRRDHARPTVCRCPDCTGRAYTGVIVATFAAAVIVWLGVILFLGVFS